MLGTVKFADADDIAALLRKNGAPIATRFVAVFANTGRMLHGTVTAPTTERAWRG